MLDNFAIMHAAGSMSQQQLQSMKHMDRGNARQTCGIGYLQAACKARQPIIGHHLKLRQPSQACSEKQRMEERLPMLCADS